MRVLLVEDETALAETLAAGLRADGFAVDIAGDGVQALTRMQTITYDALVLDIMLPGPSGYEIRVTGLLDSRWAASFDGMRLTPERGGTTTIHGPVVDQAALHGLLRTLRDLGLSLVSVTQVDAGQPYASPSASPHITGRNAT